MRIFLILLLLLPLLNDLSAQQRCTISGFVREAISGECLGQATVYELNTGKGTACNSFGFYSLTLPEGEYTLRVDYVGYATQWVNLSLCRDTALSFSLESAGLLEEVSVTGYSPFLRSTLTGKHTLPLEQAKMLPALLGETDVMKVLHTFPGVNSGTEGLSGFSVRGGSPEQTQILLDGVPVYHVNHALGYFSVFNGEALQELTLYKSGIPARYGGRLSSVLDIAMKEGNQQQYAGKLALSPLAGSVTFQGPIQKDKASFLISARRTWVDALLGAVTHLTTPDSRMGYGFYDLNAKVNWNAGTRDRLFFSFYNGRDRFYNHWKNDGKKDRYDYAWGNLSTSLRWNRVVSPRMFFNLQTYYSRFHFSDNNRLYNSETQKYELNRSRSFLEEYTVKADFDYLPFDRHHLRYGGAVSYRYFAPEMSRRVSAFADTTWKDDSQSGLWSAELYIEDEWQLASRWLLNIGLRATGYYTDHVDYYSLEPRLALTFLWNTQNSLKFSWTVMQQPLHLLTNSALSLQTDLWVPVTDRIKPACSHLLTFGFYRQFSPQLEFSTEIYYNDLHRVIRYQEGIHYLKQKDKSWQDYVYTGKGRAYGWETMLCKRNGVWQGWIAYTLSRSERSFPAIQQGAWFPFEYDRRHKLNVVADYALPDRMEWKYRKSFSMNFVYASGSYTTMGRQAYAAAPFPEGSTKIESWGNWWQQREYIDRPNNCRLPDYHHLDVAFHLKNKKQKGDSWSFSIYNLYFRKNPSFYFRTSRSGKDEIRQISLLPFVPSVTWRYEF